jgi:hypothetical protein
MTIGRDALIQGHRKNIERYSRLLATKLSFHERSYIHKRIAQEQAELERLQFQARRAAAGREADAATVIAAQDRSDFDLDSLLHPAQAFQSPEDVVCDPDLTLNEKRAILASWASDACAVDSMPALRKTPNGRTVSFDEVVDALRRLDDERDQAPFKPRGRVKRVLRRRRSSSEGGGGIELQ